jgi:hypothetical protein
MTQYYIFAKDADIDGLFAELSQVPSVTSIIVRDNSGIMPARYVRVSTEMLTDVGLIHRLKNTAVFQRKIKIMKELESYMPLV